MTILALDINEVTFANAGEDEFWIAHIKATFQNGELDVYHNLDFKVRVHGSRAQTFAEIQQSVLEEARQHLSDLSAYLEGASLESVLKDRN